ncbi:RadC family protein [Clostridiisalibacter paucivorans]|uniref:RadC family protein n=1 Tax=Clostridiisalibacter paucivorans TaxID=408753 RepID=UPI00047E405F|nr:DNA repair protein RadC [Clostridiisalibacter paucivorans]
MNCNYTIKDMPKEERPREKLYKYGPKMLSNSELLAIIIRTGSKKNTALELSNRVLSLDQSGLEFLSQSSLEELMAVEGIGRCKAAQILSAIELGKRLAAYNKQDSLQITSPLDVVNLLMEEMRNFKKEYFKIIMLNIKNKIIAINDISIGSLNSSIVHPREVFIDAIKRSSASIILTHNHPSGDPTPSREDIAVSKRLYECGELLGIKVLDHIIIGNNKYISLKEKNLI